MKKPTKFINTIDKISRFIGYSCGVLVLACILLSAYEVLKRYGFDQPTSWTFEVIMALCASSWVLSIGYVTERNRHISITMMELLVPKSVWKKMELLQMIVSFLAIMVLAYAMYEPAFSAIEHMERSGSAFNPILPTYLKAMLFLGCLLYLVQLAANICKWFYLSQQNKGIS